MDILNFISWIKGKRQVTSVDTAKTLLPVGLKDPRRDDDYLAGAITVQDFINQVGTGSVGPQGPIGPQGVPGPVGPAGLTWQGAWVSGNSYVVDDAVGYAGASYFCIAPTSGTTPPNSSPNWALLASQGATGPQGPQGIQGLPGTSSTNFASTGTFTTNSLTDTLLTSILIPANTYSSTDSFSVVAQYTKTVNSYTPFFTFHINTSNTLVGATQLATVGLTATTRFASIFRTYMIDGTTTTSFSHNNNTATDIQGSTVQIATATIDWTQNQYFIVAGRTSDAIYGATCRGVRIF
jgi:hypothetical protein